MTTFAPFLRLIPPMAAKVENKPAPSYIVAPKQKM
jgi:hypothetical protein